MTVIQPNSISGITSITAQGDTISLFKSDGTTVGALNVNVNASSGISTIANLSGTNINVTGVSTVGVVTGATSVQATNFYGSGASLTGINQSQFVTTSTGIHTLSNVGIATTNPTQALQVGFGTNAVTITGFGSIGVGTASPTAKLHVFGNAAGFIGTASTTSGSGISTVNFDFGSANNFSFTLTGNYTIANPINLVVGQSGFISLLQDGTGSRTASFGSFWDFASSTAPTLTTTANGVDVLAYYVRTTTSIVADAIIGIGTL